MDNNIIEDEKTTFSYKKTQNLIIRSNINKLIGQNKNKWEIYYILLDEQNEITKTRYNKLYNLVVGSLKKIYGIDKTELRNNILNRNKHLYDLALEKNDIITALKINQEECKIMGIYQDNIILTQNTSIAAQYIAVFGDDDI